MHPPASAAVLWLLLVGAAVAPLAAVASGAAQAGAARGTIREELLAPRGPQEAEERYMIAPGLRAAARTAPDGVRHLAVFAHGGDQAVVANYSDQANEPSGFGQLRVWSNPALPPAVQFRAAGYVEGFLTAARMADQLENLKAWVRGRTNRSDDIERWLVKQDAWSCKQAERRGADGEGHASIWGAVSNLCAQVTGLMGGYNVAAVQGGGGAARLPPMTRADVLMLNAIGDLIDLIPALNLRATGRPGPHPSDAVADPSAARAMTPAALRAALEDRGHCSVLIRLTGDLGDILMGHTAWFSFTFMNRIYKFYNIGGRRASFSSYPGMLSSLDDFYVMPDHDQRMVMLQTTNAVLDKSLWSLVSEHSLLAWQRVRAANALARSGEEWVSIVGKRNSGTYNNQYMVVDLKKFTPGEAVEPGLLWVVEQIPGYLHSEDLTRLLELGYFSSFNVPFFRKVYDRAGYAEFAARAAARGPDYEEAVEGASYQLAARSKIFRRDAGSVQDLDGLKRILRSNGFMQGDPITQGHPGNAICARNDLDPDTPRASGCIDGKVTNYAAALEGRAWAVNGPTAEQGLPPFAWEPGLPLSGAPHRGQARRFDFAWQEMRP